MTKLRDANVVITGAGSGIGALMAIEFARAGAHVALWDKDTASAERMATQLQSLGDKSAHAYVVDVTDIDAVNEAAKKTLAAFGAVDIVVLNAGVVSGKTITALSDAEIRRTFEVNTLALYWVSRAFLPSMIEKRRGHIVTIASAAGLVGVARQSDYSASKHAAVGFAESLRVELAKSVPEIKNTVVCPFYISTGMFEGVRSRLGFMLPILHPEKVAHKIVAAIASNKAVLMMPPAVKLLPFLRILPPRGFDALMNLLGVNASMDTFRGRQNPHT